MESKVRAHVFVKGKVQGVLFRYTTRDEANIRGVKGWVRNMSDGRLEAVFEGDKEKVDEMVEYCHYGPPAAKVSSVKVIKGEYTGVYTGFSIRR
ncbi:MAG: acylphosphatase [Methanophagales archaeon]|nr:acylphosphatase [Methanophagales archaeon]